MRNPDEEIETTEITEDISGPITGGGPPPPTPPVK